MIFDRKVDPLTPFLTQYSYQGQVDEYFSLQFNKTEVPKYIIDDEK